MDFRNAIRHLLGFAIAAALVFAFAVGAWAEYTGPDPGRPGPDAVVSGSVQCPNPGLKSWCKGGASLELSANEPLTGFNLTVIEGKINNGPDVILCGGVPATTINCSYKPSPAEGKFTFDFWAVSTYGDTSRMGSAVWLQDATPPSASLNLDGELGASSWYIGDVQATVSCADTLSGLNLCQVRVDGKPWKNNQLTITADGDHTVDFRATDQAGWETVGTPTLIQIDQSPPTLIVVTSGGIAGRGGWYIAGPIDVTATGSDATSGLESVQYSLNGNATQDGDQVEISVDGRHTVQFFATDVAGNRAESPIRQVWLDSQSPTFSPTVEGTLGGGGWYRPGGTEPEVIVLANPSDVLSGVASTDHRIGAGGAWTAGGSVRLKDDGVYAIEFRASDEAGNQSLSAPVTVGVDVTPPDLNIDVAGVSGDNGWYRSAVTVNGISADATSGLDRVEHRLDPVGGGGWQSGASFDIAGEGNHTVEFRAFDVAGNVATAQREVLVDSVPPASEFLSPPEGSSTQVSGNVKLSGTSLDANSGLQRVEYSICESPCGGGDSWKKVNFKADTWSFTWNSRKVSNGTYEVFVRALDRAGNLETTAQVTLVVNNVKPTKKPTATATRLPPPTPTFTPTATATSIPGPVSTSPPRFQEVTVLPTNTATPFEIAALPTISTVIPIASPPPAAVPPVVSFLAALAALGMVGLMSAVGGSWVQDRRYREIRRLQEDIQRMRKLSR